MLAQSSAPVAAAAGVAECDFHATSPRSALSPRAHIATRGPCNAQKRVSHAALTAMGAMTIARISLDCHASFWGSVFEATPVW